MNLHAPINYLGYGQVGKNILKEAVKDNNTPCLFPIGPVHVDNAEEKEAVELGMEQAEINYPNYNPTVKIFHDDSLIESVHRGINNKYYGWPIFEMDTFSPQQITSMSSCDNIIVCSKWAKSILDAELAPETVHVVPLGVDTSVFNDQKWPDNNVTRFYNMGKWEVRKGHDILIEAFNKAFTKKDSVELHMFTHNRFLTPEETNRWINLYKGSPLGDRVYIYPRLPTSNAVAEVVNQMHCGVFPARAEGWNLEGLEALACGRYVIMTDYSGQTEYMDASVLSIPITKLERAYDGKWFHGQGNWGCPDVDALVHQLRVVHEQIQSGAKYNNPGIIHAHKFTWTNTYRTLKGLINEC